MTDKFHMNSNKLAWHTDRVKAWLNGERIAPIHIDVGLSKGCNIKCLYCFGTMQRNKYERGKNYFPREALLRYVREAGEIGVRSMAFIGEAEPTLNPNVYDAIVEAKNAGVDVALGTNGVLLDSEKNGEMALEHLSWIRFNISAASEEAYQRIHTSKDFNTVMEKIKFCVDYKQQNHLPVTVGLQMVLIPEDVDQAIPLAKLGKQLGVDYLVIKQCSDSTDNTLGVYNQLDKYADYRQILEEAENISSDNYNVIIKWRKVIGEGKRIYKQCLGAPFLLYSSGDGKLYPCGMFFDYQEEKYRMADLVKESFKEAFEGDRYWKVIEEVKKIDVCNCYSGCRTDSINEHIWELTHPPEHVNFI